MVRSLPTGLTTVNFERTSGVSGANLDFTRHPQISLREKLRRGGRVTLIFYPYRMTKSS